MRPVRIANHLVENGVETQVLHAEPSFFDSEVIDNSILPFVDKRVKVTPVCSKLQAGSRFLAMLSNLGTTESATAWLPALKEELEKTLDSFSPDIVIVSMPPFCLHRLLGWLKRAGDVFLVVDLRDAWSQWGLTPYKSYFHYLSCLRSERKTLELADLVLVTSPVTRADLLAVHSIVSADKIVVLPNSFDEYTSKDFQPLNSGKSTPLDFLYVGSFYFDPNTHDQLAKPWYKNRLGRWLNYSPRVEDWSYRGPERLLRIFSQVFDSLGPKRPFQLTFIGRKPVWWESMIGRTSMSDHVRHLGRLSKKDVLLRIGQSDGLLVTSSKVLGGKDYSIAGKTFEYLAARKPIVGFVCEGAQHDLLEQTGVAICLDPDKPEAARQKLERFLLGEVELHPRNAFIDQFQTSHVLSPLLDEIRSRS
jgi:Glycosyl transferase 4-like domain